MTDDRTVASALDDDARTTDRRRVSVLRYPERRSGFDRRLPENGVAAAGELALRGLRDRSALLASVLVAVNVLNVTDLLFTLFLLSRGAAEGNPVMDALIGTDPLVAAAFKVALLGLVSATVWRMRRYRSILAVGLIALAAFVILTFYELLLVAHVV